MGEEKNKEVRLYQRVDGKVYATDDENVILELSEKGIVRTNVQLVHAPGIPGVGTHPFSIKGEFIEQEIGQFTLGAPRLRMIAATTRSVADIEKVCAAYAESKKEYDAFSFPAKQKYEDRRQEALNKLKDDLRKIDREEDEALRIYNKPSLEKSLTQIIDSVMRLED